MSIKLIIDTDKYAGNFEREMRAYITGYVGEYDVTHFDDLEIQHAAWWQDHITEVEDDGHYKTVTIEPTPGYFNNGYGVHYVDDGTHEVEALRAAQERHSSASPLPLPTKLTKWPAYQSVAIHTDSVPPQEVMEEFIARAADFCLNYGSIIPSWRTNRESPVLLGIRVVRIGTTAETVFEKAFT